MGLDAGHRSQESCAAVHPRRTGVRLNPNEVVVQPGLRRIFTPRSLDQRATGKTHLLTDPETIAPTLTRERMVADAEEMAAWVRREFGKDRIFVLGHSWGSFLGLQLAQRHPQWLHAYIGVCQLID